MPPSRIYIDGKLVIGAGNDPQVKGQARMIKASVSRGEIKLLAMDLKIGESFLIPFTQQNLTGNLYRDLGMRFTKRKEGEFSRIIRVS
jgi:hypothetical protein